MNEEAPVLSPREALKSFYLPPGYKLELVASEPLVVDPVEIEFGPKGRMWVVEMRSYMPNIMGEGERVPTGKIAILEDTNGDGQMDKRTTYLDSLILPRAIKVLEKGVLVGAPPNLYWTTDTDGDDKADNQEIIRRDYGNPESNPEHNANGLMWGMDNWIHNADHDGRLYYKNGTFKHAPTVDHGQWYLSMDDYGRIYTNSNSDPLHIDLLDAHYYDRNPNMMRTKGLYEDLVEDETVWPVRPTPGVNRGYRPRLLRPDSTLSRFTGAGSPVVYRGDRLPEELQGDVFVSEPSGNLVRRFEVKENADGKLEAFNPYDSAEFLTSTDERFRPVNFASAPDGTFYVVDMYRGIIQHRDYITDYLEEQIRRRDLEKPVGLGRIYRVVHKSTKREKSPDLSKKSNADLVYYLYHPNGWWRDMAQQLIVQRGETSVEPELRELIESAKDERVRMHALWTLDGLEVVDPGLIKQVLNDPSPQVRAAGIRIAEPFLNESPGVYQAVMDKLNDKAPAVRRQLAASLGELSEEKRNNALMSVIAKHGDDPVVVDAVISGLHGQEMAFLNRLLQDNRIDQKKKSRDALQQLTATAFNAGNSQYKQQIFSMIGEDKYPSWQQLALLKGVEQFAPPVDEDEIERVALKEKPTGLLKAGSGQDPAIRKIASDLKKAFHWPGKPTKEKKKQVKPLTSEEQQRFKKGKKLYMTTCAPCHGENGKGKEGAGARLVGSDWVLSDPQFLTRIILQGKEGDNLMPPLGHLSKQKVAAIQTYIRRAWGNRASAVDPVLVENVQKSMEDRKQPWTEGELKRLRDKLEDDT